MGMQNGNGYFHFFHSYISLNRNEFDDFNFLYLNALKNIILEWLFVSILMLAIMEMRIQK